MYKDIDAQTFKSATNDDPNSVIIDVRSAAELAEGVIPGALHIDLMSGSFAEKIKQLDKNKSYYLYCRSGNRSGMAAGAMSQWGFKELYNLAGGIMSWNGPVEHPGVTH